MKRSLRSWLWRVPVEQEIDEEIAFHLDMHTHDLIERGMDPAAARQTAMGRFGNLATFKRTCVDLGRKRDRKMQLTQWIDELRSDIRFAMRQLRRSPAFAAVAATTLALGIGANSAIFALVDATLLRPLLVPSGLLPAAVTFAFDARVAAFCGAAALLVGLLFGLAPAWQATEFSSSPAIASDSRTTTGRTGRMRSVLVVAEVATAVLLLVGAGLLLRTLIAVETVDRGYSADRALTMLVDPLGSRYPTAASLLQFFDAVEREVTALPGVRSMAWTSTLPLGRTDAAPTLFEIVGDPPLPERQRPTSGQHIVSPTYFATLDLPVVTGRGFTDQDTRDGVPVCMVSEAFVRSFFQGRSPIGMRVALRPAASPQVTPVVREIVGVARQLKGRPDEKTDLLQIYVPMTQNLVDDIFLVVRPTSGRAEALAPSVRATIARIDRDQLVSVRGVMTLEDVAWEATERHRFRAVLVITFAGLALLLAMIGVFGILAYSVQQRVREVAVRRALGASTGDVLRLVIGSATRMIATGAVIGLMLSTVLGRLLATLLFGVQPLDPVTLAFVTAMLALSAAVSIAGPAWTAASIDPAVALRTR